MIRPVSPVFWKELVQVANRRRTYVVRTLFLSGLFGLFALFWLTSESWSASTMRPTEAAEFGHRMFLVLAWAQFLAAALFTPALTADMLTGEKRANTLGLLFLTRLSNFHVVQDKGLSRVAYLAQLLVLMVPFLFVCLLFGGVSTFQIFLVQTSVLSVVLAALAASLLFSTLLPDYRSAMSASYLSLILFLMALPLLGLLVSLASGGVVSNQDIMAWTSPFYAMIMASAPHEMESAMGTAREYAWIGPLAVSFLAYGVSVCLSALFLPIMAVRHAPVHKPGVRGLGGLSGFKLLMRTPFLPFVLLAEIVERNRKVGRNPIYWQEAGITGKTGRMQQLYIAGVLSYAFVAIAVLIALLAEEYQRADSLKGLTVAFFVILNFFLVLYAVNGGGASVASEREQNTLDVLLSTALTTRALVLGKFFGVLRSCAIHLLFPLFLVGFHQVLSEKLSAPRLLGSLAFLGLYVAWATALGIFFSARAQSSVRAVGNSVAAMISPLALILVFGILIQDSIGRAAEDVLEWMVVFLPGTWSVGLAVSADFFEDAGKEWLGLLLSVLLYGGSTAGLLALAGRRLNRIAGRS